MDQFQRAAQDRLVEVGAHFLMGRPLVALEGEHVIGVGFVDFARGGFLAVQRVEGDDAAGQFQSAQQVGHRGDFVALAGHRVLTQGESLLGGPGADDGPRFLRADVSCRGIPRAA